MYVFALLAWAWGGGCAYYSVAERVHVAEGDSELAKGWEDEGVEAG